MQPDSSLGCDMNGGLGDSSLEICYEWWAQEIAHQIKSSPYTVEELSSIPRIFIKKWNLGMLVCASHPSTEEEEMNAWSLSTRESVLLGELQANEKPCINNKNKIVDGSWGVTSKFDLWLIDTHIPTHMCTHACTHVHKHTERQRQRE